MATKPSAAADTASPDQDADTTLLDVQSVAVKRLIARGKERGYITFDELNAVLPPDQNSSEQIEDVMANFSEMGIQVVEGEEAEEGEAPVVKAEKAEEEGEAEPGQAFEHVERPAGAVLLDTLWTTWNRHRPDALRLASIADAPGLTPAWIKKIRERLDWLAVNAAPTGQP